MTSRPFQIYNFLLNRAMGRGQAYVFFILGYRKTGDVVDSPNGPAAHWRQNSP